MAKIFFFFKNWNMHKVKIYMGGWEALNPGQCCGFPHLSFILICTNCLSQFFNCDGEFARGHSSANGSEQHRSKSGRHIPGHHPGLVENDKPKLRAHFPLEEAKLARALLTGADCCFKLALISRAKIWPKLPWQLMQIFFSFFFSFSKVISLMIA